MQGCVPRRLFSGQVKTLSASRVGRSVATNAFTVRPYTVRKGDTLFSIARKRGFEVSELTKLNLEVDPNALLEGQTLLVPAQALSERDREIIAGVSRGAWRTYPVRKGEDILDILEKRKISTEEFMQLNPDVIMSDIKENQVIKLPTNKFTVREREMLTGTGIIPAEFFDPMNVITFSVGAAVGIGAYALVNKQLRNKKDE